MSLPCIGAFSPEFAKQVKGAARRSALLGQRHQPDRAYENPRIPAVHMNTRMIVTTESWFGGGADLNPTLDPARTPRHPDTVDFHARLKQACDDFDPGLVSPNTRNGRTNISGCRIAASRAAWAASSMTITTAATGTSDFAFTKAWAKPFSTSSRKSSAAAWRRTGPRPSATNRPSGAAAMSSSICSMTAAPHFGLQDRRQCGKHPVVHAAMLAEWARVK